MAVKRITAEVDGQKVIVTADIPDDATQDEIEQAVSGAHASVQPPPAGAAQGKFAYPPGVRAELSHSTVPPTNWDLAKEALKGAGKFFVDPMGLSHGSGLGVTGTDESGQPMYGINQASRGPLVPQGPAQEFGATMAAAPAVAEGAFGAGKALAGVAGKAANWIGKTANNPAARDAAIEMIPRGDKYLKWRNIINPPPPPAPKPSGVTPSWSSKAPTGGAGSGTIPGSIELPPPPAPPIFRGSTNRAITLPPPGEAAAATPAANGTMLDDLAQSQAGKSFAKLSPEQQATVRNLADRLQPKSAGPPSSPTPVGPTPESPVMTSDPRNIGWSRLEASAKAKDISMAQRFLKQGLTPEQVSAMSEPELNAHLKAAGYREFYGKHLSRSHAAGKADIVKAMKEGGPITMPPPPETKR